MVKYKAYREARRRIEQARREDSLELDLWGMELTEIPEVIASLSHLQELNLSGNKLTKLPEAIASLTQLQYLDISGNELTEIPEALASLTQLEKLDLSENQLTELPEALASLTQLQELYLSYNRLTELPEAIASLTQLQHLDLSLNQLTELPEVIKDLTKLTSLSLSENQFVSFPKVITSLQSLEELYAIGNQIEKLPNEIVNLTQLRKLYLGGKRISPDKEFGENTRDHGNNLTSLPQNFTKLTQLVELGLDGNPLNADLAAAYEQGTEAVLQYLRAKAENQVILNEAKLILIGEGEVGKTCLLGALRGDEWVEGRPTTHGIEIKPVIVTNADTGTEITLNGWDFGGQRVYRPTHQLFFSAPAVYLVVWKPREGPQQGFVKEWITLIKNREPDAKVLIVATHGGPGQRQPDIDKQEILDQFGKDTIVDFFHVDSKPSSDSISCSGIAQLKQAIARIAVSLPEMVRSVPAKWQQVREKLQKLNKSYLPYNDVIAICAEYGIDQKQAELFLRISHTLGHFIHYDYDPTLRDIVILKPDWLAKAISFVLDDETMRKNNGLVEFAHLSQLWSHPPFPGESGYPKKTPCGIFTTNGTL